MPENFYKLNLNIKGKVQGVNFRSFILRTAQEIGLTGRVHNLPSGGVAVEAYGHRENLNRLIQACQKGPRASRVEDVQYSFLPVDRKLFKNFQIKF